MRSNRRTDLGDLFHTPLDGKPIGAVVDIRFVDRALTTHPDRQRLRDDAHDYLARVLRFDTDEAMLTYIQAGVALLDLHQLRHIGYAARMTETVRRLRDELRFADQCATNTAFRGNITILDPRWNVFPEALPDGEWDDVIPELRPAFAAQRRDPRIIHFAYLKPWRRKGLPASDRWWRHAHSAGLGPHYAWQFIATRGRIKLNALRRRLGHRR